MLRNLLLITATLAGIASASAATFSISPATVAYSSTNTITLAVGGIVNGQAVLIEEFADDNTNGLVDAGEQLVMRMAVRDGEASTFPPSTATNRPGDDDGATNGAISKVLRLGVLAERLRVAGAYVFRLSAADASFAPIVRSFTMEQGNHAQSVTGMVFSAGVPVSFAFVALLAAGEDSDLVAGALSDGSGTFTVRAPAGSYNLIALKAGYVMDFGAAPAISLLAGSIHTQNVTLVAATRTISGSVVDAVTSNGVGGLQMFAESQEGLAALAFTDANGNFTVPVTEASWEFDVSDLSTAIAGYGRAGGFADATSGSVAGLRLALSRALGEFQLVFFFPSGSFNDGTNGSIGFPTRLDYYFAHYNVEDDNAPTNVTFSGPAGSGLNSTPSEYFSGSSEGSSASYSTRSVQVPAYPPAGSYVVNYKGYPQTFVLADPDAANRQIVLVPRAVVNPSGQLQEIGWIYRNTSGNVIAPPAFMKSLEVRLDGANSQLYNGELSPGTSTHVLSSSVSWADVRSVQMVYNDDRGNQYVSFWTRGTEPLQIRSQILPNATIGNPCEYLFLASGGRSPYLWSMVSGNLPGGVSFTPGTGELTGTPQANGRWNFRLRVTDDRAQTAENDFALVVGGGNVPQPRLEIRPTGIPGEFGLRLLGEVGRSYSLQYSTTLSNWATLMTTNLTSSSADLVDRAATNQHRLYRLLVNP